MNVGERAAVEIPTWTEIGSAQQTSGLSGLLEKLREKVDIFLKKLQSFPGCIQSVFGLIDLVDVGFAQATGETQVRVGAELAELTGADEGSQALKS